MTQGDTKILEDGGDKMSKAKRYKEPKTLKAILILLILMLITACGALFLQPDVQMIIASLAKSDVRKYDAASEYVKDTYTRDNTKYLPIRISKRGQTISKEDIKRDFEKDGIPVKSFSPDVEPIRNGTKVSTDNGEYTVILYGDVNCDGEVDVLDAQDIIWHIVRKGDYTLTGVKRTAANVDDPNVDELDIYDASRIVAFILGKSGLIDVLPISDIQNDHEKPVITLAEDGEVIKLKVSTEERPNKFDLFSGVTVTDNVDYNIKSKVQTSGNFNIYEPGTYTINYNVKDSNGNEADTKTRKIEVVNYVTGIDIEKTPAKTEFANGEKIDANSMAGMKLIAKMAYTDWRIREIPLDKVTFSPDIAYVEGKEPKEQEISIIYHDDNIDEDIIEKIKIKVTPHMPKFEVDGEFENYIEIGDNNYQIPNVRAYEDENPDEELDVKYYVTIKTGGNVDVKGPFDNPSDASLWIRGDFGTEYVIEYTATNKYGLENTVPVPVSVIDTISTISVDKDKTNLVTTEYIDGQSINLDGLAFTAMMKSGETKTIYYRDERENFVLSEDVAKYTNGTQKITLKYKKSYPFKNGDREYDVSDNANVVTLDIKKKLETINQSVVNVNNGDAEVAPSLNGNIYETVFAARLESPANEEDITANNVRVLITPNSENNNNALRKAWLVQARDADGNIIEGKMDLYVAVTGNGSYKINVIPYTLGEGQEDTYTFQYVANNHMEPNHVRMTGFKKRVNNADGTFTDVSTEATMVKTGDTIFTDVIYQRKVKNTDLGITSETFVDVYPPDKSVMSAMVRKGSLNSVLEAGKDYTYTFSEPDENEVTRLEITINKDLDTSSQGNRPQQITVQIGVNNVPLLQNGANNTAIIYNTSKYTLSIGNSGSTKSNPTSIGINVDSYNNYKTDLNSNIAVSKVMDGDVQSDKYYTILPISLKDQYGDVEITGEIFQNEVRTVTTDGSGVDSAVNLVDVIPVRKVGNNYIKQVYNADTHITVDRIGIVISNAVDSKAKLTELQNSLLEASFGNEDKDSVTTNISPITVYTNPASTVKTTQTTSGTITCFKEEQSAILTTKDNDISFLTANEIGIKVSKGGTRIDSSKVVKGSYTRNSSAEFGYIVEPDANNKGTIKLTVWSKYRGSFEIIPYIIGKENDTSAEGTPINMTFAHDTSINKVVLKTTNETSSDELITGTLKSDSLNVPRGGSEAFYMKCYHDYGNGCKYEITNIEGQDISIFLNDPTNRNWANASQVAKPDEVDWENLTLWGVAPTTGLKVRDTVNTVTSDGKLELNVTNMGSERIIDGMRVFAGGKIREGNALTLTIKINGSKKHPNYTGETFDFTVGAPKAVELQVGNSSKVQNIFVYQTAPKNIPIATFTNNIDDTRSDKLYKLDDGTLVYHWDWDDDSGIFYTLLEIKSNNPIVQAFLSDRITDIGKKDKLTFIDDKYSSGAASANTMALAGFNVSYNSTSGYTIAMDTETSELTHVGIAISKDEQDFDDILKEDDVAVDVCNTYVYNGSSEPIKTIKIQAIRPSEANKNKSTTQIQTKPNAEPEVQDKPADVTTPNVTTPSATPVVTQNVTPEPSVSPSASPEDNIVVPSEDEE